MSLQGTIETFAIGDVLRLLAATSKSGRLQVQGPDRSGTVWVDGGKVLAAESPSTPHADQVADVLFQLVRFDRGSFSFELDRHPAQPGEPVDIEAALGEAESMVSEWREIERRVPSSEAWVGLRSDLADDTVTVTATQWKVVRAVGGGRTVAGIGDALGLGELPSLRAVDELLGLGLVDVGTGPAEADTSGPAAPAAEAGATAPADLEAGRNLEAGRDDGEGGEGEEGVTSIGDAATVSTPAAEGEARRRLDALAGAYGLPSTPTAYDAPPSTPAATAEVAEAGADAALSGTAVTDEGSGTVPFPADNHSGAAPHGDPLATTATPTAEAAPDTARPAPPPPPPGYDYGGGYGQSTQSEYDQGAYSAYGEYGQQAQQGYGDYGQSPLGGYGSPPPSPTSSSYGDYYGDSARAESPTSPTGAGTGTGGWAPPAPPAPTTSLAPEWTSGRGGSAEGGQAPSPTAEAGSEGTGWPTEGVARARSIFESAAPPPPPPPPATGGATFGTGTQWFDGGPERLAPPPPPPPPTMAGSERGNGSEGDSNGAGASNEAAGSKPAGADDASNLERQLQHLSPKAQEAIKRSSGLFEGRSSN